MICGKTFAEFIELLASTENTFAVSQRACSALAEEYHISKIVIYFRVGQSAFTPFGEEAEKIIYQAEEPDDSQAVWEREFHTGEKGYARLSVMGKDSHEWTLEEKADLETMTSVLFFHLARHRMITQAQRNAMTDYLTGLPNTGGYMEQAAAIFARHELPRYNAFYFNLKGFGLVNRKFGQRETDEIIKRYAMILRRFANEDEVIGRLGGDNFVALILKERTQDFLKLLAGAETYAMVGGEHVPVLVRAVTGVYEIDESITDFSNVLSECAVALNVARNVVKKPYLFASKELNDRVFRQKQIAARFPEALKDEEFLVYYQPKVETDSYMIVGAEALVRWFSAGKIISPAEFVPVVEQDGSICRLDFYMLEHVCRDIRSWLDESIEPVQISVNFSRKHLSNPNLAEDIMAVLQKYEVPPKYIEIEVTETTDEEEQGMLSLFMNKMKQCKISTAIDDFGTGYSSLNILRTFPVDVLKIDKSFIDNGNSDNDSIVLTNIIRMAKELHMDVITEGVEKWSQVKFLHDMKCNKVQGFLFDKPMPRMEFEKKIRTKQYDITKVKDIERAFPAAN